MILHKLPHCTVDDHASKPLCFIGHLKLLCIGMRFHNPSLTLNIRSDRGSRKQRILSGTLHSQFRSRYRVRSGRITKLQPRISCHHTVGSAHHYCLELLFSSHHVFGSANSYCVEHLKLLAIRRVVGPYKC